MFAYSVSRALPFSLLTLGLVCLSARADELNVSNRTDLLSQNVSGPGKASSFYDSGIHVLHETDVRWTGMAFDGKWNSLFNSSLRYTDSNQFDPERLSLQKLEWRLFDAHTQLNLGDYFANLSPYSMTKGIKGLAFQRNLGDDQNYVRAFYGSFDGQWAFLYKDPTREPMNTLGGGVRLQRAGEKFRLGLNLAEAHDQDGDRYASFPAYAQILPAVDWEYRESALVVSGEHAYSDTDEISAVGVAAVNKTGSAHKLTLRAALKNLNLDGHAERVAPDFISRGGGATADRLRYYLKADYKLDRNWRLFAIYDDYEDNLDNQKTATTEVTTWETGFKRARAFSRRHMNIALSWRNKQKEVTDGSSDQTTNRIKFKINDRVAEHYDWYAEIEQILDEDHLTASDADSKLFDLGLNYRRRLQNNWDIRADLNIGRQETGTLNVSGTDISDRIRLGLTADKGNGTVFGASLERNTADLVAALADNHHNRASLYWQSKPAWIKDGSMKLEYADYIHTFTQNAANDYREKIVKLSLQWNFQKEAKK
ncbi:MAG: hypothetical protein B7Y41_15965 [Hydrogenophilales bacterium 28-61-23]|nr:MAG: hypothetical protein B7Y41_15965 [Hydrogenophilales bacterium 28-61-23]